MRIQKHSRQANERQVHNQFIAGLVSETLRVKLVGKGHRHKVGTQEKVTLREVVETATAFESTSLTNTIMKTARGTQEQEQVNYSNKPSNFRKKTNRSYQLTNDRTMSLVLLSTSTTETTILPAYRKRCSKCGNVGHFSRAC